MTIIVLLAVVGLLACWLIGKRIRANVATLSIVGVVRRIKIRGLNEQGGFVQAYFSAK